MDSKRFAAISIDLVITALINNIPFFFLVIQPSLQGNDPKDPAELMSRAFIASLIAMLSLLKMVGHARQHLGRDMDALGIVQLHMERQFTRNRPLVDLLEIQIRL
ncbi:MAG: hypothetical protein II565_07155, partial [Fibrobacter sp.]|nr:hypothetical protein [Fibrobacter sp.]